MFPGFGRDALVGRTKQVATTAAIALLILCFPGRCSGSQGEIRAVVDFGILPQGALGLGPEAAVSRSLWAILLYEAFGAWLPQQIGHPGCRDLPRDRDGDVFSRLLSAGWIVPAQPRTFLPFQRVTASEAAQSLVRVLNTVQPHMVGSRVNQGLVEAALAGTSAPLLLEPMSSSSLPLELSQATALVCWMLELLGPPGGSPSPLEAVTCYLRHLGTAIESGRFSPPLMPVVGAARANLVRNAEQLKAAAGGMPVAFRLMSLEPTRIERSGLLTVVTVKRRMLTTFAGVTRESSVTDIFRLRLSPNGWLIYQ
jgi:hypothetical protein